MENTKIKLTLKRKKCLRHKTLQPIGNFTLIDGKYKNICDNCVRSMKSYGEKYRRGNDTNSIIKVKINHCIQSDRRRHFDINNEYMTFDDVNNLVKNSDGRCPYCNTMMKFSNYVEFEKTQFTINRIQNEYPHIKGNINLCCWDCNRHHKL